MKRGNRNIKFIETYCRIPEGPDIGKPVKLRPWQKREIRKIYDNPSGTRRAIISWARKNAKSSLAAFLLLLHLCGPEARNRKNSQLYSAAQSREQAALIFNLAAKIVRMSADLRSIVIIRDTAKELICPDLGTKYRALSSDATTAYGLNPAFIIHDELGQVRGPRDELYEALETATGAQEDPLSVIISTQAPTDSDLLSLLIDDALARNDPRVTCSLHTAPIDDDAFTEKTIRKANPAFGDFLNKREVLAMADDAKRIPSREAEFRNLVLNQRVEANQSFISRSVWDMCAAPVEDIRGTAVYGGLDLSSVSDLTALVLIGKINGVWQVKPTFWLPEEGLREKAQKDHAPYDMWHKDGFLHTTPGRAVQYEHVAFYLRSVFDIYDIRKIGFDKWNMHQLKPWLLNAGFTERLVEEKFFEFSQNAMMMAPALRYLRQLLLQREIAHGGHPILKMNAACAVVHGTDESVQRLSKNKSTGRIDGMVALAMAVGVAPLTPPVIDIESLIA
jgi:phage terminase large subunit-like protein